MSRILVILGVETAEEHIEKTRKKHKAKQERKDRKLHERIEKEKLKEAKRRQKMADRRAKERDKGLKKQIQSGVKVEKKLIEKLEKKKKAQFGDNVTEFSPVVRGHIKGGNIYENGSEKAVPIDEAYVAIPYSDLESALQCGFDHAPKLRKNELLRCGLCFITRREGMAAPLKSKFEQNIERVIAPTLASRIQGPPLQYKEKRREENLIAGIEKSAGLEGSFHGVGAPSTHHPYIKYMRPENFINLIPKINSIANSHLSTLIRDKGAYDISFYLPGWNETARCCFFFEGNVPVIGYRTTSGVMTQKINNIPYGLLGEIRQTCKGVGVFDDEPGIGEDYEEEHMRADEIYQLLLDEKFDEIPKKTKDLIKKSKLEQIAETIARFNKNLLVGNPFEEFDNDANLVLSIRAPAELERDLEQHIEKAKKACRFFREARKNYKTGKFKVATRNLKLVQDIYSYHNSDGQIKNLLDIMDPHLLSISGNIGDGRFKWAKKSLDKIEEKQKEGLFIQTILKERNWVERLQDPLMLLYECNSCISNNHFDILPDKFREVEEKIEKRNILPDDCSLPEYIKSENLRNICGFGRDYIRTDFESARSYWKTLNNNGVFLNVKGDIKEKLEELEEMGSQIPELTSAVNAYLNGKFSDACLRFKMLKKDLLPLKMTKDMNTLIEIQNEFTRVGKGFEKGLYKIPKTLEGEISFSPESTYIRDTDVRSVLRSRLKRFEEVPRLWGRAQELIKDGNFEIVKSKLLAIREKTDGAFIRSEIKAIEKVIEGLKYLKVDPKTAYDLFLDAEKTSTYIKRNNTCVLAVYLRKTCRIIEDLDVLENGSSGSQSGGLQRLLEQVPEELKPHVKTKIDQDAIKSRIKRLVIDNDIESLETEVMKLGRTLETSYSTDQFLQNYHLQMRNYINYRKKMVASKKPATQLRLCIRAIDALPFNYPALVSIKNKLDKKVKDVRREEDEFVDADYKWDGGKGSETLPLMEPDIIEIREPAPSWLDQANQKLDGVDQLMATYRKTHARYVLSERKKDDLAGDLGTLLNAYKVDIMTNFFAAKELASSHRDKIHSVESSHYTRFNKRLAEIKQTLNSFGIKVKKR